MMGGKGSGGHGRNRRPVARHKLRGTYRADRHGSPQPAPVIVLPDEHFYAPKHPDGTHAVRWFAEHLRHVAGELAGSPFTLSPWQRDLIIQPLFGTARADGLRQYRTAFVEIPRKNGKSTLAAGIALYLLFADGEAGAEIYSAAADRDQARIVFNTAWRMVEASPVLLGMAKLYRAGSRAIEVPVTGSVYRALSADAYTKHGLNAHGIIFDELHTQPNRELWDVLTTSTGSRRQPITVAMTTAGYDRTSICYEQHEYAEKVRSGLVVDPSLLAVLFAARAEDDWQDERIWHKANPGLGQTVYLDHLRQEAARAVQMPAYQNTFRRLHLNQWTQQSSRWIDLSLWDENAGLPLEAAALVGRPCYGALDMSTSQDMTAWVLLFPRPGDPEAIDVLCRFWCPEARLTDPHNRYRHEYEAWKRAGFLETTPGEAIDYAFVRQAIIADYERFRFVDAAVDVNFQGFQMFLELQQAGLPVVTMRTGTYTMSPAMKELERRLILRKARHGGNPVLRWMADNTAVKSDHLGNLVPDKATSQGRIDGIVALVMALDRAMRHAKSTSVYDTRGALILEA